MLFWKTCGMSLVLIAIIAITLSSQQAQMQDYYLRFIEPLPTVTCTQSGDALSVSLNNLNNEYNLPSGATLDRTYFRENEPFTQAPVALTSGSGTGGYPSLGFSDSIPDVTTINARLQYDLIVEEVRVYRSVLHFSCTGSSTGTAYITNEAFPEPNGTQEVTPEITATTTSEPTGTPEITPEVTATVTSEPTGTPEVTPETTPELTATVTSEPSSTPEITPEVTATTEPSGTSEVTPEVPTGTATPDPSGTSEPPTGTGTPEPEPPGTPRPPAYINDGRVNPQNYAPVALYCEGTQLTTYMIDASGQGQVAWVFDFASGATSLPNQFNISLSRTPDGRYSVLAQQHDGKWYLLVFNGCPAPGAMEIYVTDPTTGGFLSTQ